jgi:hypothetical protein
MKKLEDIPKKQVFEVPEGYFEKLPGIIQSRVTQNSEKQSWQPFYRYGLRVAVPAVLLLAFGIFWYQHSQENGTAESILASIQTEDLVAYLGDSDLTTEELLDEAHLNADDADQIEESVYEFDLGDSDF